MKIEELLREGKKVLEKNNIEEASIISRSLLQYVLKIDRNKLVINKDEEVENNKENEYIGYIKEVAAGKPVQYITNKQEFMGLSFFVDENVLIPQPDTEILVEEAIKYANQIKENVEILDMCTGSGCIGVALAKHVKNAKVTLVDISTKALEVAKKNAKENEVKEKVNFIQSDMFENIKSKFDVIVSNPPYIKTKVINELDLQVQNEPHLALDGGENGLKFYEILINEALKYLKENGKIFLEIGYDQKKEVEELARNSKLYKEIETVKDLANNDRVIELKR